MKYSIGEESVSKEFLEKTLKDFYYRDESCKGWETNVITQPNAVKNIVNSGASRIAAGPGVGDHLNDKKLAAMIDHTLLKPDATIDEIKALCDEARKYSFASVCVNPCYVQLCSEMLSNTKVKVCTVIGFPLGASTTENKKHETEEAVRNGAQEIDMVINIGQLKSGNYDYVASDIRAVVASAKSKGALVKVILETALLSDEEKIKACIICKNEKADFVKTSTGFSKGGATTGDIALMKYVVGSSMGVKASGGIRSREDAEAMVKSGADRIGASASVKIISGETAKGSY
ncbi:MAG: deoxyribose-phosphate aldolase [Ignavibacteriaceae bacterium]|nr:deoxyribose-phosphate aldolase [Ignavibacteriaceae bacterium]